MSARHASRIMSRWLAKSLMANSTDPAGYTPVGTHETLLVYLVRRLLENDVNTSYVNRIADTTVQLEQLMADPVLVVDCARDERRTHGFAPYEHPRTARFYGPQRRNSARLDLANEHRLAFLSAALLNSEHQTWLAAPVIVGETMRRAGMSGV